MNRVVRSAKLRGRNDALLAFTHNRRLSALQVRRGVLAVLAVGLAAVALAIVLVLSHKPLRVLASNGVSTKSYIELEEQGSLSNCQKAQTIPKGTSAIRLSIEGVYFSPAVSVAVAKGGRVIARGSHAPGGPPTPNVVVPVPRLAQAVSGAWICTAVGPTVGPIRFAGTPNRSAARIANGLQQALLRAEYLRPGRRSWWPYLSKIFARVGLGRAPAGDWVAFLLLALMLALVAAAARLALEELR
jgi:hypothetical protein